MASTLLYIPLTNKKFTKDKIRRGVLKKKQKPRKQEIQKKKKKNKQKMEKKNKKEKKPCGLNMKANLIKTKTKNALFSPMQSLKNYIILNKVIPTSTLSLYYNVYHYL